MVAFIKVGLFPGYGGTWLYPRVLNNVGKAAELLFTGDFLESEDALKNGALNHLVPAEELEDFTMEMISIVVVDIKRRFLAKFVLLDNTVPYLMYSQLSAQERIAVRRKLTTNPIIGILF